MTVRKRGGTWQADFMVKGVRYREQFKDEMTARRWELEAHAAAVAGTPVPTASPTQGQTARHGTSLSQLLAICETSHWRNNPKIKEPETAIRNAREAISFLGPDTPVTDVTTDRMKQLVRHIIDSGRSYATADRKLAALSKMLRIAVEKGMIPRVPSVPLARITGERLRILSKEEVHVLLQLWLDWHQPELHAFTIFALHCGARLEALLQVRWSDFGPDYRVVLFRGGDKGSPARTLPMSKASIAAVTTMRTLHPESAGPFCHLKKDGHMRTMWDEMQAKLGWDDVVIHTMRHTCATWMLENTGNLKKVQTWLGHKRIETTLKYAKLVPGALDEMADMMDDMLGERAMIRSVK